ncbi:hypothetical protein X975_22618, partial [Stegodyphus mimosarum]
MRQLPPGPAPWSPLQAPRLDPRSRSGRCCPPGLQDPCTPGDFLLSRTFGVPRGIPEGTLGPPAETGPTPCPGETPGAVAGPPAVPRLPPGCPTDGPICVGVSGAKLPPVIPVGARPSETPPISLSYPGPSCDPGATGIPATPEVGYPAPGTADSGSPPVAGNPAPGILDIDPPPVAVNSAPGTTEPGTPPVAGKPAPEAGDPDPPPVAGNPVPGIADPGSPPVAGNPAPGTPGCPAPSKGVPLKFPP